MNSGAREGAGQRTLKIPMATINRMGLFFTHKIVGNPARPALIATHACEVPSTPSLAGWISAFCLSRTFHNLQH